MQKSFSFIYIPENEALNVENSATIYYSVVFLFLFAVIGASLVIDDLTLIFGVISGVSECLIIILLPCIFFLLADKMAVERAQSGRTNLSEEHKNY